MDILEEIKAKISIVDLVSQYVELKPSGSTMKAFCPFHKEKTPSFHVYPEKGMWHCYGACDTSGDIFSFMEKIKGIDFKEALRLLADQAGITLPDEKHDREIDVLYEINTVAAEYYVDNLKGASLEYMVGRGFNKETLTGFQIGFSPTEGDKLYRYMKDRNYSEENLVKAGLVIRKKSGRVRDYFIARVIFPIKNESGRIIGFAGRTLDPKNKVKYINSQSSAIYSKKNVLWAIYEAKSAIRAEKALVLVEGYTDAMMAHQHGYCNTVALCGSSLTPEHLIIIKKYTKNLYLSLDPDTAGKQATLRGIKIARKVFDGHTPAPEFLDGDDKVHGDLKIIELPNGMDPDVCIHENPAEWQLRIIQARPVMDFLFDAVLSRLDLDREAGRASAADQLMPVIRDINDPVEQELYMQKLGQITGVDVAMLRTAARIHQGGGQPLNLTAGLPVIVINNRQLRDMSTEVLLALYKANATKPGIFTRGGSLVRVSKDAKGNPYIEPLSESALRGIITRSANFIKVTENAKGAVSETQVSPPLSVVKDILSLSRWEFPHLLTITEVPVIRSDGSILAQPGYDPVTLLYYHPSPDLIVPAIPDTPTETDVMAATALIKEVICDFPFDSEASGANAIAAMLTPMVRPMIDGLAPLAVFDKPQPGTGASLLVDVISLIASGQTAGMLGGQRKEEEWRKAITTILIYGRSVICIDNIDGVLDSTSLATVLTARVWRDRMLGRNEEVLLPNMSTWIANGNNIRLAGDLSRRAYRARLDAQLAQPWLRPVSRFKHPDLIRWLRQKRGDIVAAMLTVARSWVVAGKPKPNDLVSIGSYESFCEVLGGILDYIKVKGFLGSLQQMYSDMDVETPQWGNFLEAWHEVFGDLGVTAAEVVKNLKENEGFAAALPDKLTGKDAEGYTQKLGNALAKRTGVRFPNGLMVQKGNLKQRAVAWVVTKADNKLTSFSFKSELGESCTTLRASRENDPDIKPGNGEKNKDDYRNKKWVEPDSHNSLLDTKSSELGPSGDPGQSSLQKSTPTVQSAADIDLSVFEE